jgi:hypothetical protein
MRSFLGLLNFVSDIIVEDIASKDNPADILTRNPYVNELEWDTMDEEENSIFEEYYSNRVRATPLGTQKF